VGEPQPRPKIIENPRTGEKRKRYTEKLTAEERRLYGGEDAAPRRNRKFFFGNQESIT
jgi:hypothetical protein